MRRWPEGETGALVVTPLFTNNITPFLRWMSGDLVALASARARQLPYAVFPVVRHAERTTGFFKIKGINISHGEFEDLLFRQRALNDFKCEAVTVDRKTCCAYSSRSSAAATSVPRCRI